MEWMCKKSDYRIALKFNFKVNTHPGKLSPDNFGPTGTPDSFLGDTFGWTGTSDTSQVGHGNTHNNFVWTGPSENFDNPRQQPATENIPGRIHHHEERENTRKWGRGLDTTKRLLLARRLRFSGS